VKGGEIEPWGGRLSELAKRPNVLAKISGLIAYGDPDNWNLDDLRPFFEYTVSAFGHNRLVWGSDSPVCNLGGGLETWISATHALTNTWQTADKSAFLHDNAAELWG
jgi:predicted TIM-barrel fold metal-dependent hydrolase